MKLHMKVHLSEAYKNHQVLGEIEDMKALYENLSFRAMRFVASGTKCIFNYETYVFMSIQGTLDSIKTLLLIGRITDAFVLARKVFDDILTEIYLSIELKDKYDVFHNSIVEDVQQWLEASCRIPSIKKILKTLETSAHTKKLYPYFGWKTYLEHNRKILDDCVHSNRYSRMLLNCNTVYLPDKREKQLDGMSALLKQLMMIQVAFVFHLSPQYMMASYYFDCLDVGETPPEEALSWVAPYAQTAFDKYIRSNESLADFIKSTCYLKIQ